VDKGRRSPDCVVHRSDEMRRMDAKKGGLWLED
jgi:hypothetical protein